MKHADLYSFLVISWCYCYSPGFPFELSSSYDDNDDDDDDDDDEEEEEGGDEARWPVFSFSHILMLLL